MLVFSKAKLVILSVPKTGTTAIEAALAPIADIAVTNPPDLKHAPVYRYNRFFRPMVEKFIGTDVDVAAVIREPVSWLGSRKTPSCLESDPAGFKEIVFHIDNRNGKVVSSFT